MDLKYIGILKHHSLLSIGALDKLTSVINSKKKKTTDFVNLATANLYAPPEEEAMDMEEDLDENANTLEDEQGDEVIEESDHGVIVESDESELSDDCRYGDFYETYHDKELE